MQDYRPALFPILTLAAAFDPTTFRRRRRAWQPRAR